MTLLPSGTPTPPTYATAPMKRTYVLVPMIAPLPVMSGCDGKAGSRTRRRASRALFADARGRR